MNDTVLRTHKIKRYGWVPDLPDQRDHPYMMGRTKPVNQVDLRAQCPPVYDQSDLGSCTANAIAAAIQFDRMKQGLSPDFVPSRLQIYYNERVIEGTVDQDAGAMIRDGIKSVAKLGVCPEPEWPYAIAKFADKPPAQTYADALPNRAVSYARLFHTLTSMRNCLAVGFPFVFGFTVYESFESDVVANSGVVPMPGPNEGVLGGHAVLAVGYDNSTRRFLVRNSWGSGWGMHGFFTIPYDYLTNPNLADDMWTIRIIAH